MYQTTCLIGLLFLGSVGHVLSENPSAKPNSEERRAQDAEIEKLVRAQDPQKWKFAAKLWKLELKFPGNSPPALTALPLEITLTNVDSAPGELLDDQTFPYEVVVMKDGKEPLSLTAEGEKFLHLPTEGRIVRLHRYLIPPSQSEIKVIDLAKLFHFAEPGNYSVRVGRYEDLFRSASSPGSSLDFVIK